MESFEPATLLRTVAYRVGPSACHAGLLDKLSGSHASYTLECTVIALGKTAIVFSRQARFSAFRRLHERMLAELERDEPCGARHHCDVPPLPASRPLALVQDRRFCEQRALELTAWFNSVAAGKNATGLALESAALFSFLGGCSLIERMRARADEIHLAQVIAAGNRRRMGGQALRACIERAALAAHAHEIGAAPSDVAPAGPVEAHAPLSLVLCAQQDFCAGSTEAQRATHADDASSSSSRATARALLDDVDSDAHDEPADKCGSGERRPVPLSKDSTPCLHGGDEAGEQIVAIDLGACALELRRHCSSRSLSFSAPADRVIAASYP